MEEKEVHKYYASGKSLINGKWCECGWTVEASSFTEAAQIIEQDATYKLRSISKAHCSKENL